MTASMPGSSMTRIGSSVRYSNAQFRAVAVLDGSEGSAAADGHDLAVLGQLAEPVGVDLADHPAADQPDSQRTSTLAHPWLPVAGSLPRSACRLRGALH